MDYFQRCFTNSLLYISLLMHIIVYSNILYLSSPAGGRPSDGAHGGFNPVAELKKLRQAQQSRCRLEIGELLRVRGPVKTSRQQREIMASTYCEPTCLTNQLHVLNVRKDNKCPRIATFKRWFIRSYKSSNKIFHTL